MDPYYLQEDEGVQETSKTVYSRKLYKQIKELIINVSTFRENIKAKGIQHKSTIFIGQTGAGKSTLVNYLARNELEAVEDEYEDDWYAIRTLQAIEGIEIGNNSSSCTKIPAKWVSDEEVAYWDCPGFGDTEGPIQDITDAYFVNELFNKSKEVRVVLVVNIDTIKSTRHDKFLNLANDIDRMGLINSLQSVSLIVTSSKLSKAKILNYLSDKILPNLSDDNNQNLKKLVQYFIENSFQVEVFPYPKMPGTIDTSNVNTIQQVIEEVDALSDTKLKPPISENTVNALSKWGKVINDTIKQIVEIKISQSIRAIWYIVKWENKYSNLKISLNAIKDKSDILSKSYIEDILIKVYQKLQNMLQVYNEKDDNIFKENIDLLKFFTIYNSEIRLNPSNFNSASQISKLCKYLGRSPEDSSFENGVLVIKHCILRMSDVNKEYNTYQDK